ncbi:MAG: glycosyltransferase family 39 protein [Verrucomicrobia bacterium]|jgi:4-amino-4-deoxy-L-arabinose transferase-like glycosyltransferase|nr:glycosyltransferase family 39 protein [Verrucomicrobiota bacterium]
MPFLQDVIHKIEVGSGMRYLKVSLACLAVVMLMVGYNWRSYRNFSTQEAMDAAQVGRNLAEGNGYTTQFVRPFSLYLVKKRSEARFGVVPPDKNADYAHIRGRHPDLANPPGYPCVLAALMKVLPFKWVIGPPKPFWSQNGRFWRYEPDFLISLFNEVIFFAVILLTFLLARRLFDPGVAWLSGILLLSCELLWRFSVSGLSTLLLLLIFMGLVWCLVFIEREVREPKWGLRGIRLLAVAAGLLVGLGALTRYAFGWMMVPVLLFFILFAGQRRAALCLLALMVFAAVLSPWVYRNYRICGAPFGTATFAVIEGTAMFPENKLGRTLEPNFSQPGMRLGTFTHKLLSNSRQILQNDLPRLGGSWLTPLFLAGLLLGFNSPAIRRLRYFLMMSLAMLVIVQAMGRTQLSEDSPELNSENLLVLLVPLIFVLGVSLFFLLLEQMKLLFLGMRYFVVGLFAFIMCLPMAFTFLPPSTIPVMYPPYYPPAIQQVSGWMKENELMMSDIPWAVAWYGNRQCIWTTLDAQEQFFAVNDLQKPVRALYLTPQTMDSRFLTQWVRAGEHSWGNFVLDSMLRREIPPTFPLREAPSGFLPEQLFLTDWKRWKMEPPVTTPTAAPAKKK